MSQFLSEGGSSMPSYELSNRVQIGTKQEGTKNGQKNAPKKRASIACIVFRKRKVRCEFSASPYFDQDGQPTCSNCKAKDMACTVEESKRRKRRNLRTRYSSYHPSLDNPSSTTVLPVKTSAWTVEEDVMFPVGQRTISASTSCGSGKFVGITDMVDGPKHEPHMIYQQAISRKELFQVGQNTHQTSFPNKIGTLPPNYSAIHPNHIVSQCDISNIGVFDLCCDWTNLGLSYVDTTINPHIWSS